MYRNIPNAIVPTAVQYSSNPFFSRFCMTRPANFPLKHQSVVVPLERDSDFGDASKNLRVSVTYFSNRILIVLTQRNKIGSLVHASLPMVPLPTMHRGDDDSNFSTSATDAALEQLSASVEIFPLLGSHAPEDPTGVLLRAYACSILGAIAAKAPNDRRPLVLGLSLLHPMAHTRQNIVTVTSAIMDTYALVSRESLFME